VLDFGLVRKSCYLLVSYEATDFKPNELCVKFLGLKPRPTIEELEYALYPLRYNPRKYKGYVFGERTKSEGI
jgi:hypothetical protein